MAVGRRHAVRSGGRHRGIRWRGGPGRDRSPRGADGHPRARVTEVPAASERIVVLNQYSLLDDLLAPGIRPVGSNGDPAADDPFARHLSGRTEAIAMVGPAESPNLERIAALEPDLISRQPVAGGRLRAAVADRPHRGCAVDLQRLRAGAPRRGGGPVRARRAPVADRARSSPPDRRRRASGVLRRERRDRGRACDGQGPARGEPALAQAAGRAGRAGVRGGLLHVGRRRDHLGRPGAGRPGGEALGRRAGAVRRPERAEPASPRAGPVPPPPASPERRPSGWR